MRLLSMLWVYGIVGAGELSFGVGRKNLLLFEPPRDGQKGAEMCLHEDSDPCNVPITRLPRVRVEMLLSDLNEMYVKIGQAQRVLREGNPDGKERILRELLADVGMRMDDASGGFLAPRNM